MNLPSQSVVSAVIRHGVTSATTTVALFAMMGLIGGDDVHKVVDAIHEVGTGLQSIAAGVGVLGTVSMALYAGLTATKAAQIASVKAIPGVEVVKDGSGGIPISAPPSAPK